MRVRIILLTLISFTFTMCNTTFLNHQDFKFKEKDFVWSSKIEALPGQVNIKDSTILFGMNIYSTFLQLSPDNGAILNTLKPFTIEDELNYPHAIRISVNKQKYSEVFLKTIDRQYRGDNETYFLIVKTLSSKEFTILFSRSHFFSIQDITHFKEGKYLITYNGEAGSMDNKMPYTIHIGLLDLEKIIKQK